MISAEERRILEATRARLSGVTWAAYRRDLDVFARWCNGQGFSITRAEGEDVQRWVDESEESSHTVRRRLAAARKFYRMALEHGLLYRDPTEGVRPPPAVTRQKPPRLQVETARALLRAARVAGVQQEALVRLLLIHSLGATEVGALSVGNVDLALDGSLRVPGRRARGLLLTAGTLQVLQRHLELRADVVATQHSRGLALHDPVFVTSTGRRMARGDVWRTVKALGRAAGVEVPSLTLAADVRPLERYLA